MMELICKVLTYPPSRYVVTARSTFLHWP